MTFMKYLFSNLKMYKKDILKTNFFMILESIVELFLPILLTYLINIGVQEKNVSCIVFFSIVSIFLILIGLFGSIMNNYYSASISSKVSFDLRYKVFSSICDMSYSELDKIDISKSITVFSNDIATVGTVILYFIRLFLKVIFLFGASVVLAFFISPQLFKIVMIIIPICLMIFILIFKYAFPYFDSTQKALDKVNHTVRENVTGIRLIKAFNQEKKEIEKFDLANSEVKDINIKAMKLVTLTGPILQFFIYLATFITLIYSNHLLHLEMIQIGNIMAFLQYLTMILSSLLSGTMILILVLKSWVSLKRIYSLCSFKEKEEKIIDEKINIDTIEFKNVSFAYGENTSKDVLQNISFKIKKGEKVALIGRCGSGKSTLLKVMSKLYPIKEGEILINNKVIDQYSSDFLKKHILYVNQNATLLSGTILSNIKLFHKNKNLDTILETCEIKDIIKKKKDGILSKVEAFGNNFSGGEKNRIILARSLFRNSDVLLLDDTLNAVDLKTEKKIYKNIHKNYPNITILQVNSRLSNLKDMDKIILLENGKIEAIGNFEEISKNHLFLDFLKLQEEGK